MMGSLVVKQVERLVHSAAGSLAANKYGLGLIEKDWLRWQPCSWDEPAILVFTGEECVAGINWSVNDKTLTANIDFAWCSPDHPRALVVCLLACRKALLASTCRRVAFGHHEGNERMAKLVRALKIAPVSHSFEVRLPEKEAA